jgi:hypothetical protein
MMVSGNGGSDNSATLFNTVFAFVDGSYRVGLWPDLSSVAMVALANGSVGFYSGSRDYLHCSCLADASGCDA